ncbi:MAG: hypothetical protein ACHQ1H_09665 [Nitrososphaerales archaeon]
MIQAQEISRTGSFDDWKLRELYHLQDAARTSLIEGGSWLVSRIHPNGPILKVTDLNFIYKGVWGMWAAGVDHSVLHKSLKWIEENSLHPNGDFFFEEEEDYHRIGLRIYRPLAFMKVAAWIDDPLVHNNLVTERLMEYQDKSGGVYDYIGEKRGSIENPVSHFTPLNTAFFVHAMVALDRREAAVRAGEWLRKFVQSNLKHMHESGIIYTETDIQGKLKTEIKDPDSIIGTLNLVDAKQEFWNTGVVMSALAVLYDAMRSKWNFSDADAWPLLEMALEFLEFESRMPSYTYEYPSKCKVAWGAGEVLRVLVKYDKGNEDQIEKALQATRKTLVTTFIQNQLPNGAWPCEHYVVSKKDPEYKFDYRPLKGKVNVPYRPLPGSKTSFIEGEEIAGEFLGEMRAAEEGITALIASYNQGK